MMRNVGLAMLLAGLPVALPQPADYQDADDANGTNAMHAFTRTHTVAVDRAAAGPGRPPPGRPGS